MVMRYKICAALYIPIFFLLVFLTACSKHDPTNGPAVKTAYSDRQKAGWVGPVRTVTEETSRSTMDKPTLERVSTYDQAGNRIEMSMYLPNGLLQVKFVTQFNPQNKKIRADWYKNNSLDGSASYLYDSSNNLVEINGLNPDGSSNSKSVFRYDVLADRTSEVVMYDAQGAVTGRQHRKDSKLGAEETEYRADGTVTAQNTYDPMEHIIATTRNAPDGSKSTSRFVYDAQGRQIEFETSEGPIASNAKVIYTYEEVDPKGNFTKRTQQMFSAGLSGVISEIRYYRLSYY